MKNNSKWLDWAIQIEDESNCDVEVGLDSLFSGDATDLDRNQLISLLQQHLGNIFSQQELEEIAEETEQNVQQRIKEKVLALSH